MAVCRPVVSGSTVGGSARGWARVAVIVALSLLAVACDAPSGEVSRSGERIGEGTVGEPFDGGSPIDFETFWSDGVDRIAVRFTHPSAACVPARATASIGRAEQVLIEVLVPDEFAEGRTVDGCRTATSRTINLRLTEPLGDRRTYAPPWVDDPRAVLIERTADELIGLTLDDASSLLHERGIGLRDLTGSEIVAGPTNAGRINVELDGGVVEWAWVG